MLSIQFHYSEDRLNLFEQTVRVLEHSEYFRACEKIILFNDKCSFDRPGFKKICLPSPFCRADFWQAGLEYDKILYLDTDRIFPLSLFEQVDNALDDSDFVYPLYHHMLKFNVSDNFLLRLISDNDFFDYYQELFDSEEVRTSDIQQAVGRRNPMSGCLGYTKQAALDTLPNQGLIGWGFSDMLWFTNTANKRFAGLDLHEIHLHHNYNKTRHYQLMNTLHNGSAFTQDERYLGLARRVGIYKSDFQLKDWF